LPGSFARFCWCWYYTRISIFFEKAKKETKPLIVAIFLVTGGLLSGAPLFRPSTGINETNSSGPKGTFFVSSAQGAENTTALFGEKTIPPVSAISGDNAPSQGSIFSVASGAIRDLNENINQGR
jgi:hypothetical protein